MIFVVCADALPARHRAAAIASDVFATNLAWRAFLSDGRAGIDGYGAIWEGSQVISEGNAIRMAMRIRCANTCGQMPANTSRGRPV